MIQANNLCLSFGSQKIFDNLSFTIGQLQRVGLVGRNGSGKSTLLKAIAHSSVLDSGSVSIVKGKKIAYMPQDVVLASDRSIIEEALSAFGNFDEIKREIAALELALEANPNDLAIIDRYADLQEQLMNADEDMALAKTKKLLMGLGFTQAQFEQPVSSLSVGWKMRVVLAKLLLQDADFYLFDEPTNHLDLIAKEWFLHFLKTTSFGFLLVCHERYFLDELCNNILDLERGKGTMYTGTYSQFEVQKEHNLNLLESAYAQQQKEIKQKQETIDRFKAKASKAGMAQSMMKALDKIERIEIPPKQKTVSFNFPPPEQSGKVVLTVNNVSQKFGDKKIFEHVSCTIERGQKVSIIAPNGGGKTTLFNVIVGALPIQSGSVTFGHNVKYALFNQDQNAALNGGATVIDNIRERCPKKTEQAQRSMLGCFLFKTDDVQKKVMVLSGGEKNRVGMVSVLLQDANLLFLDEPTNHLDIQSKEILLKALQDYKGTIVFVSHDRDFINDLATHIIELTPEAAHMYAGNYDAYAFQKKTVTNLNKPDEKKANPTANSAAAQANAQPDTNQFDARKKVSSFERKIEKLEKDIHTLELSFEHLTYGTGEFDSAQYKLNKLKQELVVAMAEWEKVQKKLSA